MINLKLSNISLEELKIRKRAAQVRGDFEQMKLFREMIAEWEAKFTDKVA